MAIRLVKLTGSGGQGPVYVNPALVTQVKISGPGASVWFGKESLLIDETQEQAANMINHGLGSGVMVA